MSVMMKNPYDSLISAFVPQKNIMSVPKEKKPTIEDMEQKPVIEDIIEEKPAVKVKKDKNQKPLIEEMEEKSEVEEKPTDKKSKSLSEGRGRGSFVGKKESVDNVVDIQEIKADALNHFEKKKEDILIKLQDNKIPIDGIVDKYTLILKEVTKERKNMMLI